MITRGLDAVPNFAGTSVTQRSGALPGLSREDRVDRISPVLERVVGQRELHRAGLELLVRVLGATHVAHLDLPDLPGRPEGLDDTSRQVRRVDRQQDRRVRVRAEIRKGVHVPRRRCVVGVDVAVDVELRVGARVGGDRLFLRSRVGVQLRAHDERNVLWPRVQLPCGGDERLVVGERPSPPTKLSVPGCHMAFPASLARLQI